MIGPMFPFQIAAGIIIAFALIGLTLKGMSIHRANTGWRSAFGAAMFIFGFMICGFVIIGASLATVPQ